MLELLIATIGLGIAGIDPVGALIAIGALSNGARERNVVIYGFIMIIVTVVLGVVLSLVFGPRIAEIDWSFLNSGDRFWAIGETIAGAVLLAWGIRRVLHPATDQPAPKSRGISLYTLSGVGVLYGLTSVLDPTFVSLVVVAGRDGAPLNVGLAHLLWILISQLPMVIVIVAILAGKHQTVIGRFQSWWGKYRPVVSSIGTAALLLAALFLLADAGWWLATGEFLVDF